MPHATLTSATADLSRQHIGVARPVTGDDEHDRFVLRLGEVRLTGRLGIEAAGG